MYSIRLRNYFYYKGTIACPVIPNGCEESLGRWLCCLLAGPVGKINDSLVA